MSKKSSPEYMDAILRNPPRGPRSRPGEVARDDSLRAKARRERIATAAMCGIIATEGAGILLDGTVVSVVDALVIADEMIRQLDAVGTAEPESAVMTDSD